MNYKLPIVVLGVGVFAIAVSASAIPLPVQAVLCMGFGYLSRQFYEEWKK